MLFFLCELSSVNLTTKKSQCFIEFKVRIKKKYDF